MREPLPSVPRLYVILDHGTVGDDDRWIDIVDEVSTALDGHSGAMLQLRVKNRLGRDRLRLLRRGWQRARQHELAVLANGDLATARRVGCHGAHWPEARIADGNGDTPEPSDPGAPAERMLRAASVHSVTAVRRALAARADFAVFAPVFEPGSKAAEARGVEALEAVATATTLPVLALGGIDATRVAACLDHGAHGVAVVSAVLDSDEPGSAALHLLETLDRTAGIEA